MTNHVTGAPIGPEAEVSHSVEHLFRHEAGRIVSYLTRLLGPANLQLAEECVQEALLKALRSWPQTGIPANPPAWLLQVARNGALDAIRHNKLSEEKVPALTAELNRGAAQHDVDEVLTDERLRDDELRMIFMCCHPALSTEASVALSLKTVGGFGVREIASAFLAEQSTIAQRLVRAKRQIAKSQFSLELPHGPELSQRLETVLQVLYLMFNEGYTAHQGESLIRSDLCYEALRIARLVADSEIAKNCPQADALVSLMALQAARLSARTNQSGNLVLLDDQDRTLWDDRLIALGFHYFERSMCGAQVSAYHIEAAIAATHTRAQTAAATDWSMVLQLYDSLAAVNPSPIVALNRCVAVSRVRGAEAALTELDALDSDPTLRKYYLFAAVRGHFLEELNRDDEAEECYRRALELTANEAEQRFLRERMERLRTA